FIGLGYTFMRFDASGTHNGVDVSDLDETRSGININLGLAYDINEKLSIQVQYDFVRLGVNDEVLDSAFNKNVTILKIGLGYRL
ncbi:MAG: outer membrane beta-barrel protein, partial [Bacteroidota bacterium]